MHIDFTDGIVNAAAQPTSPYSHVLDRALMQDLLDLSQQGGGVLLGRLVDAYVDGDAPEAMAEMQSGLTAGNKLRVAKAAHGLKGSSGVFGAVQLVRLLADVEGKARAGNLSAVKCLMNPVEAEVDSAKRALIAYRQMRH